MPADTFFTMWSTSAKKAHHSRLVNSSGIGFPPVLRGQTFGCGRTVFDPSLALSTTLHLQRKQAGKQPEIPTCLLPWVYLCALQSDHPFGRRWGHRALLAPRCRSSVSAGVLSKQKTSEASGMFTSKASAASCKASRTVGSILVSCPCPKEAGSILSQRPRNEAVWSST